MVIIPSEGIPTVNPSSLASQAMSPGTIDQSAIQEYYGRVLERSADLQTNACCTAGSMPPHLAEIARKIAPEVVEKFYGCGSPIPPAISGKTVLDLGCGTGRDVFLCSALVGPTGKVIGVDMTEEQLAVARRHEQWHADKFGFSQPNTQFLHGMMEDLASLGLADESVDVVISNCVINLSPMKERVFSEILRVLRPGGEIYFSDVFVDRRLDPSLQQDPVLVGECLAGALYWEDFRRMMLRLGVPDIRTVAASPITVGNPEIVERLGSAKFTSVTVRAFKLATLEDKCEDFGQVAIYEGGIEGSPLEFHLDDHHCFELHRPMLVCGNSAAMVQDTRFGSYFRVIGDRSRHFGLFPCGPAPAAVSDTKAGGGSCC